MIKFGIISGIFGHTNFHGINYFTARIRIENLTTIRLITLTCVMHKFCCLLFCYIWWGRNINAHDNLTKDTWSYDHFSLVLYIILGYYFYIFVHLLILLFVKVFLARRKSGCWVRGRFRNGGKWIMNRLLLKSMKVLMLVTTLIMIKILFKRF